MTASAMKIIQGTHVILIWKKWISYDQPINQWSEKSKNDSYAKVVV